MHVLAVNGSPRKNRNTAQLLNHALEGARSQGATTELIHLWDIDFRGCSSCFTCKRIGDKGYGICSMKDGLKPVLDKIREVDGLILGSPVYYFSVLGACGALWSAFCSRTTCMTRCARRCTRRRLRRRWSCR